MLNKIIRTSLDNRVAVVILSALLLLYGMTVVLKTDVDIFPDLSAPTVAIMTEAPGMAPEEVEKLVTYPIETAVNGSTGVRRVRSSSDTGFSVVMVEFDWDTDVYAARQTVSEKLATLSGSFPAGVGEPTLGPQSSILGEMYIIGLTADSLTDMTELRTIADRSLRPMLLSLRGVSQVSVLGGDVKEWRIGLRPERMNLHGVSLDDVREAVEGMNVDVSGGVLYEFGNEYLVKASLSTADIDELKKAVVVAEPGRLVTLADVADIEVAPEEPRLGLASLNTHPAVLLTVTKQPKASTIDLTREIDESLESFRATLPADVKVNTDIFRQADFISRSISNLQESLFVGAIFVIVVLFFFLMNLRTTLISLVALPLSIIVTVIALHLMGLSINTMSLGGIAIAIGSLVDDAIVDVENVYKRLRRERPDSRPALIDVIYHASAEVRMPIFNSSLIIMASFLPLFFLDGMEGRLLRPLGIAFIVALVASTIVALTVTPVLCSYLLGSKKAMEALSREPRLVVWLRRGYERALAGALVRRKAVLGTTAALFALSLGLFFTLGRSFLPPFNEGSFTVNVSALPGLALDESDRLGREAERILLSMPEISTVARKTGRAELDEHSFGVNVSEIEAPYTLTDRSREDLLKALRAEFRHLPGVNVEIGQPVSHRIDAMLSGTEAQIAVKLFGDDLTQLYRLGTLIKNEMSEVEGITDLNIEQQVERPQLDIRPRRDMLAYYGVPLSRFAEFVRVALAGEVVSQVYEKGFPYNLRLKMSPLARESRDAIASLSIDTPRGKVPLSEVAEITVTTGPNTINREDVSRRIVISANVEGRDLRSAVEEIRSKVDAEVALPEGYRVTYGGQFESEASASRRLLLVSAIALVVIVLLLYSQYRSWARSLVIMVNMPLALIGGVLILVLTSGQLNIPAIIGFISLMGIATRNGMLLMSRYDTLQSRGEGLRERIMNGSADRLNPILMTALSSALALIPLAVNGSRPGNEIQSPLAIVILGGLLSSTVLNLFVVPVLYDITQKRIDKHNNQ